jgi:glycosyltransferase involved in cell wall biosynthesis
MKGGSSRARLSIVIAAHNAAGVIETCLTALERQCPEPDVEVIVADSSTDETPNLIASRFPWVRLLHFDEPLTVPALRGRGIGIAGGDIIAILDPFSVAAEDWVARVLAAHRERPHAAIGGSVGLYRPASCSHAMWTLYLNEYGLFMPPTVQGETWIVPGSNVAYKRAALFDGARPRYPVFWKTFANWEIERASPLWLEPAMRVDLNKPIPLGDYLRTRYYHGRCFAGLRVRQASTFVRVWRAFSTPLVPAVLLWRWTRGFWPKGRERRRFILTMPAQFVLFSVWAWGEALGYLRGSGKTCEQLFY